MNDRLQHALQRRRAVDILDIEADEVTELLTPSARAGLRAAHRRPHRHRQPARRARGGAGRGRGDVRPPLHHADAQPPPHRAAGRAGRPGRHRSHRAHAVAGGVRPPRRAGNLLRPRRCPRARDLALSRRRLRLEGRRLAALPWCWPAWRRGSSAGRCGCSSAGRRCSPWSAGARRRCSGCRSAPRATAASSPSCTTPWRRLRPLPSTPTRSPRRRA